MMLSGACSWTLPKKLKLLFIPIRLLVGDSLWCSFTENESFASVCRLEFKMHHAVATHVSGIHCA